MGAGRRYTAVVIAVAVAAAVTGAPRPGGASPPPGDRTDAAPRTITLITGDRLTVFGSDRVGVERGAGRGRIGFLTRKVGGRLQVVPVDALPLLRSGRLDPRLFDVTALLEVGDTDLPLIVMPAKTATRAAPPAGARSVRDIPGVRATAARLPRMHAASAWKDLKARADGSTVWLDARRRPLLDTSVPQIGAPAAWQAGYTGTGVTVAVVDSGIDATHPDLAGRVTARATFVDGENDLDHVGHGTHVASTIAGSGAAAAGRYSGVAPGARLVDAKVCGPFGCPESSIIAGMRWAVVEQRARIVNVSLGGADSPGVDPVEQAIQTLTEEYGALFVIAAGNSGADASVESPGSADAALTVGAVDGGDALAGFSSRGPRAGDAALKPDITAPGVDITAALSKDSGRGEPGDRYLTLSGTSMATPHVAGAAALLAQRHPDWTAARLKAALMASALPNPAIPVYGQGSGRVDVPRALAQTITTDPPSISFGRAVWPHDDDAPVARTVTYRNSGGAAATLDLAVVAAGPDGAPAPAGMFGLSASRITVPAGGTAAVTVAADTRVAGPDGFTGGHLVATAGDSVTRTAFAVDKEVESYDVSFAHLGRAGQPTGEFITLLINLDTSRDHAFFFEPGGAVTARLPRGRYLVHSTILDGDPADEATLRTSQLLQPVLDLRGPQRLTLDARAAQPVSVTVPRASARQVHAEIYHGLRVPAGLFVWGAVFPGFDNLFVGALGGNSTVDGLTVKLGGQWLAGRPDGTVDGSPYAYNLAWVQRGRALSGFRRAVRDRDLATVRARHLSHVDGATGAKYAFSHVPGDIEFGASVPAWFPTPFERTEYYTAAPDLRWNPRFAEFGPDDPREGSPGYAAVALEVAYRAGREHRETWNQAVFGPALPGGYDPAVTGWAVRSGETIVAGVPMFGDGAGHAGSSVATGRVRLYREGVLVGEVPTGEGPAVFAVPPREARYRLEVVSERGAPFTLSTGVSAAWEFRSGSAGAGEVVPLALSVVRFAPRLDDRHAAPAGVRFTVPVAVRAQAGTAGTGNRSLRVDVSYDDGRTWRPAEVRRRGAGWEATVRHPTGGGFVSLRAVAADASGNTVEQTIIRAYRLA
jgi:subtilisin family serine protease